MAVKRGGGGNLGTGGSGGGFFVGMARKSGPPLFGVGVWRALDLDQVERQVYVEAEVLCTQTKVNERKRKTRVSPYVPPGRLG